MHTVGKRIIMIPVMIVVLALLFRFAGLLPQQSSENQTRIPPRIAQQQESQDQQAAEPPTRELQAAPRIDLNGPLVCDYSSKEISVTVRVHNKNILIRQQAPEKAQQIYLLNNGMLYMWEYGTYVGQKIDVSQYVGMIEMFSSFLTPDMLLSFLPKEQGQSITQEQITALKDTCTDEAVDDVVFTVPSTVTFTKIDLSDLQQSAETNQE